MEYSTEASDEDINPPKPFDEDDIVDVSEQDCKSLDAYGGQIK